MRTKRLTYRWHRRGAIAVWTAISLVTVLGFGALSVDLGFLYMVQSQLQVCADAAAMAAAGQLAAMDGDPLALARQAASEYAGKNKVLNGTPLLDTDTDVIFGQAVLVGSHYEFQANGAVVDAVKVRVRRTGDSPNGSIPLFFANVFGRNHRDMVAESTAILVPRDIAIVADLSASHNDDSELRHINEPNILINLWDVWAGLPGGISPDSPNYTVQKAGPTWGTFMQQQGWGEMTLNSAYVPANDTGLAYLPKGSGWTNTTIRNMLVAQNYNANEVNAIMSSSYDSDTNAWKARVATALGLCVWRSGLPADSTGKLGKWKTDNLTAGNNNSKLDWSSELTWTRSYPYASGSWSTYFDYMKSTSSAMYSEGKSAFRYRFGCKTLVNYLLEEKRCHDETPELNGTPSQPMQAVKEAIGRMMGIIDELDTDDQVSLEIYDRWGRHEVDLTQSYQSITDRIHEMQAGHYDVYTNVGDGMDKAITELSSTRARYTAIKVIVLLTDGNANADGTGTIYNEYEPNNPAKLYAVTKAQEAAAEGIRIYTVSVGARADTALMEQIATIGRGSHFFASGSIQDYTAQLQNIFEKLGGKRPVMLIQ